MFTTVNMINLKEHYFNKKVLITGGLGFIGSNIAHKLVEFNSKVTILDAQFALYGGNKSNLRGIENKVEFITGDIRNFRLMEKLIEDKDIIFNLGAQVSYIDSIDIPFEDMDINCKGSLIVLDSCRHRNPKARIVFPSSRMVLGKIKYSPVDENHPTEPLSIYGIHKLTGEKYHIAYNKTYGLNTVILRITNPYGIRQQMKHSKYSLVGWFLRQAMEAKTIKIFGDGNQLRDYIYVDDIVQGILCAGADNKKTCEIYNLGFGKSVKFRDMIEIVIDTVGQGKVEYVPWPADYEHIETGDFEISIEKAKKDWDWKPSIELIDGVRKMYKYYKKYQSLYW